MNTNELNELATAIILQEAGKPLIAAYISDHPDQETAPTVDEVVGYLKHKLRRRIGFAVDALWVVPNFVDELKEKVKDIL